MLSGEDTRALPDISPAALRTQVSPIRPAGLPSPQAGPGSGRWSHLLSSTAGRRGPRSETGLLAPGTTLFPATSAFRAVDRRAQRWRGLCESGAICRLRQWVVTTVL